MRAQVLIVIPDTDREEALARHYMIECAHLIVSGVTKQTVVQYRSINIEPSQIASLLNLLPPPERSGSTPVG